MKWLDDMISVDAVPGKMSITFKERLRKNNEMGYSLVMSKKLKEYIAEKKVTHMRLGFDGEPGNEFLVAQLNRSGQGVEVLAPSGKPRIWFDITPYIEQYSKADIVVDFNVEYVATMRKGGSMTLDLTSTKTNELQHA